LVSGFLTVFVAFLTTGFSLALTVFFLEAAGFLVAGFFTAFAVFLTTGFF